MFDFLAAGDVLPALSTITWDIDPIAFKAGPLTFRYYGVLFATGLMIGYGIFRSQFAQDGEDPDDAVKLTYGLIAGVIIGARLGHVFFYEPARYLRDPSSIIKFWEGGLASHGATIGMLVVVILYCWARKLPFRVIADRVALTIPLVTACVRLGNFFNSEIVGRTTDVPWAVIFTRHDSLPRHPSQLYEMTMGLVLFGVMYAVNRYYVKAKVERPLGMMIGIFLIGYFSMRFSVEFFKEFQTLETGLTMGQYLSIPFASLGAFILWASLKGPWKGQTASQYLKKAEPAPKPEPAKKSSSSRSTKTTKNNSGGSKRSGSSTKKRKKKR